MQGDISRVVVIGAGQAGVGVARNLRKCGYARDLALIGDEPYPPYERPPLSKAILLGTVPESQLHLATTDELRNLGIALKYGRATSIDRGSRTVRLADGTSLAYDRLVIATGGRATPFSPRPNTDSRIFTLRGIEDARELRRQLANTSRLAIVGGGWIGLEVAAAARQLGVEVALIEAADRLCARAAPPFLSTFLETLHMQHGVKLHLGRGVTSIASSGACSKLMLSDGSTLTVDTVFAGIGMTPNDESAREAGLEVSRGIVTTWRGETADVRIFACGDISIFDHPLLKRRVRLESWANAKNQSMACAQTILGQDPPDPEIPWFWSDQYAMNIQIAGCPAPEAAISVRGDSASDSFSFFLFSGSVLSGVVGINAAKDVRLAKRMLEAGTCVTLAELAAPNANLQKLSGLGLPPRRAGEPPG